MQGQVGTMLVTSHLPGIHTGDAVIDMITAATVCVIISHAVHKIRLVEQSPTHLHEIESFAVKHLIRIGAADDSAYIHQR